MTKFIVDFMRDETGAAAAEYALILAIVGAAIGTAALYLGGEIKLAINGAGDAVKSCAAAAKAGGSTC